MVEDVGMEIEFAGVSQRVFCNAFQLIQRDKVVLNEKKDVLEVGIEAATQFAEGAAADQNQLG